MPPPTSIQSFYQRKQPSRAGVGDGFTSEEVQTSLHPLLHRWVPRRDYKKFTIADVLTGAIDAQLTGRIIHFLTTADKDWVSVVIKDNTGAVGIQLLSHYIDQFLRFGTLVTVYVTFVSSNQWSNMPTVPLVSKYVRITPGPSSPSFIVFHREPTPDQTRLCRIPLLYNPQAVNPIDGLMTLKSYIDTGHDGLRGVRILVCVKSIGPRKSVTIRKTGEAIDLAKVGIFDDTTTALLDLWGAQVQSAVEWKPNETILLLTDPGYSESSRHMQMKEVKLSKSTTIDVDPQCSDASWLRTWAHNSVKKDRVFVPFPEGIWDREAAIHGEIRTLFTLAELDEFAREEDGNNFTGKICVVILSMGLSDLHRRRRLCCQECCGVPLFSNKTIETCRNCGIQKEMVLNPRAVGTLVDESGCIEPGKAVWSDQALNQLFIRGNTGEDGHQQQQQQQVSGGGEDKEEEEEVFDDDVTGSWEWLALLSTTELREMEEDMLDSRVTLTFGWAKEVERLCILGVEW